MVQKVACDNGKGIKIISTMRPKSITKSMKNYKKIMLEKNTNNIKDHTTSDQTRLWKMRNSNKTKKQNMPNKDAKKTYQSSPGGPCGAKRHYKIKNRDNYP